MGPYIAAKEKNRLFSSKKNTQKLVFLYVSINLKNVKKKN